MTKTILITGSTDGIGLETAKLLVSQGHRVLLHGRNPTKLEVAAKSFSALPDSVETYVADLSRITDVASLAQAVAKNHPTLDILINNAGVFKTPNTVTPEGLDVRFVVNAIAPYLLTQQLRPLMTPSGRIVNVSSAAQSPVNLEALTGRVQLTEDFTAYAQSKLALTMWSRRLALSPQGDGLTIIAVNPGSMLGSKMVKEGFGVAGGDLRIGADILTRAALADEFTAASGQYFDNDKGQFASPHTDALDPQKCQKVVDAMEAILEILKNKHG
ncbi:SDR family NAD(P)-dependent oxidoreductase [Acaryochloris sp. IP29b_bin.148]|uniref:SDR family NAD(P)-dependent oxidoreductase n=1 Tax=Acaryochloris sp. IP29b_bin.148 TaxID=2969218 RepID=UPI0026104B6D|nr:SDR family NAD(P)-dependent oxidoreductase [Acaryochloris sp. IP29b_bin.148]